MGVIDRTSDFHNILKDLASEGQTPTSNLIVSKSQSELNIAAAELGEDIHKARLKVDELRKLSKKKAIFDDKTHHVQTLSSNIQEDVQSLNAKYEILESKVSTLVSNSAHQQHAKAMLNTLKCRISDLIKDIKDALETRTNTMMQQDERRVLYKKSFSMRAWSAVSTEPHASEGGHRAQAVSQMYADSRAAAITSIQQKLGVIAAMSQKMAVEVTKHEEAIQRIDGDIENTTANMDAAQNDLLKYFQHISSNRSLILKVFAILIFFVVFFVVFLAD